MKRKRRKRNVQDGKWERKAEEGWAKWEVRPKSQRKGGETEMKMLLAEEVMVVAMTAATECEGWWWCENEADEQALLL